MGNIKLICDSMADITKEYAKQYDIDVVPLTVIIDGKEYKDGIDIETQEFYKRLREENLHPKTSQGTYAQFKEVFDKNIQEGKTIFYIASSAAATGTYQSALMAKNDTDGEIYTYDASNLTFGAGIFVLKAAELLEQGKSIEEVVKELDIIKEKYLLVFSVDTLEYLQKGGRISSTKAAIGNILNIKPILEVKDGLVSQITQVRGKKNIINKIIEVMKERLGDDYCDDVMYVGYSDDLKEKDKLEEAIRENFNPKEIKFFLIGTCIGAHSGPGVAGVLSFKK